MRRCIKLLLCVFLVGTFTLSRSQSVPRDYGVCTQIQQINQYCAGNIASTSTSSPTLTNSPRRGKAGPPGPPGPPGECTDIDCHIVNACVDEKFPEEGGIEEALSSVQNKLKQLEDGLLKLKIIEDCSSATSGRATIWNETGGVFDMNLGLHGIKPVYCDLETDGGRWLVFQRRMDGSVDFYRTWAEYEIGFGNVAGEFWLGLRTLHDILSKGTHELRIDLEDWEGNKRYAKYSTFQIGDASTHYQLTVGGYSGNAGDSLTPRSNGMKFSAKDIDLDTHTSDHCAVVYKGGWWYGGCHYSNLNGLYLRGVHTSFADGIEWHAWKGYYYSMKFTEMKLRLVI